MVKPFIIAGIIAVGLVLWMYRKKKKSKQVEEQAVFTRLCGSCGAYVPTKGAKRCGKPNCTIV